MEKPKSSVEQTTGEEESEEEDSDDESDADSSSSLGIDLSNYYTKEEVDNLIKEKLMESKVLLQADYKYLHKE